MVFAYSIVSQQVVGNLWAIRGTYTNAGGDTGGNIDTPVRRIEMATVDDGTAANAIRVQYGTGANSNRITITTTDGDDGRWMVIGRL